MTGLAYVGVSSSPKGKAFLVISAPAGLGSREAGCGSLTELPALLAASHEDSQGWKQMAQTPHCWPSKGTVASSILRAIKHPAL